MLKVALSLNALRVVQESVGIESFITMQPVDFAAEVVAAGLEREVNYAARRATELRRVGARAQCEFLISVGAGRNLREIRSGLRAES
jgi:hypothetical protein